MIKLRDFESRINRINERICDACLADNCDDCERLLDVDEEYSTYGDMLDHAEREDR